MDDGGADQKMNPAEYAANTAKLSSSIAELDDEKPDPSIRGLTKEQLEGHRPVTVSEEDSVDIP